MHIALSVLLLGLVLLLVGLVTLIKAYQGIRVVSGTREVTFDSTGQRRLYLGAAWFATLLGVAIALTGVLV